MGYAHGSPWAERLEDTELGDFEALEMLHRYPELFRALKFEPDKPEYCADCGERLLVMYGCGFDYDRKICGVRGCHYEVEYESTTEPEPQGKAE